MAPTWYQPYLLSDSTLAKIAMLRRARKSQRGCAECLAGIQALYIVIIHCFKGLGSHGLVQAGILKSWTVWLTSLLSQLPAQVAGVRFLILCHKVCKNEPAPHTLRLPFTIWRKSLSATGSRFAYLYHSVKSRTTYSALHIFPVPSRIQATYFSLFFAASSFIPFCTHALLFAACSSIFALSLSNSLMVWGSGTWRPFSTAGRAVMRSSQAFRVGNSSISMPAQPALAIQP
jgi:hypothetical protein